MCGDVKCYVRVVAGVEKKRDEKEGQKVRKGDTQEEDKMKRPAVEKKRKRGRPRKVEGTEVEGIWCTFGYRQIECDCG